MAILISFDIDGTLEVGDPPGPLTMDMVRLARDKGFLIGSCSDRTLSGQRGLWAAHEIEVDFVVSKHMLPDVKAKFEADTYVHIGDREDPRSPVRTQGRIRLPLARRGRRPRLLPADALTGPGALRASHRRLALKRFQSRSTENQSACYVLARQVLDRIGSSQSIPQFVHHRFSHTSPDELSSPRSAWICPPQRHDRGNLVKQPAQRSSS